jgi:thiol-disulfide isomerase/thioredoxin
MRNSITFSIILTALLFMFNDVRAQSGKVPPFRMMQADSKVFRAQDLPIGKPIILIYFSTDCEDCQKLTRDLLARINDFKNVSIAMITYQDLGSVIKYVMKNKLDTVKNIYVGSEGSSLFVRNYYNVTQFPFMTLYDKNGNLQRKYLTKEIDLDDLYGRIKVLSAR